MDDRLRLIQYLYGEDVDDLTLAHRLSEDEALRREFECLRETKEQLDRRQSPSPDPAVVSRVVDAAREASSSPSPERVRDRPARSPTRGWGWPLQTAGAALALVLVLGLGWWQLPSGSEAPSAEPAAGPARRAAPPATAKGRFLDAEEVPAWDDSDELVRIHRRIERLRARSTSDAWGTFQTVDRTRP